MIKKFFCVKDLIVDSYFTKKKSKNSYGVLCEKGYIYSLVYDTRKYFHYMEKESGYLLTIEQLKEHFITIEEWRERQINKILND